MHKLCAEDNRTCTHFVWEKNVSYSIMYVMIEMLPDEKTELNDNINFLKIHLLPRKVDISKGELNH